MLPKLNLIEIFIPTVLSHNHIESIEISSLTGLTKLSLAHNELREIPNTKVYYTCSVKTLLCLFACLFVSLE